MLPFFKIIFHGVSWFSYLHSPTRFNVLNVHSHIWFTLSKQMLDLIFFLLSWFFMGFSYSHSPTRFQVVTLHVDVWFALSNHMLAFFPFSSGEVIFLWGFIFLILLLSNQVLGFHSPCTYLVYILQADVGFLCNLNFLWGFHTLTLQPAFRFPLYMQMFTF